MTDGEFIDSLYNDKFNIDIGHVNFYNQSNSRDQLNNQLNAANFRDPFSQYQQLQQSCGAAAAGLGNSYNQIPSPAYTDELGREWRSIDEFNLACKRPFFEWFNNKNTVTHDSYHSYMKKELEKRNKLKKPQGVKMLGSIGQDVKDFVRENKSVIYWIAIVMVVDHYFFQNAFRDKLKDLIHKVLGKVDAQLDVKSDSK